MTVDPWELFGWLAFAVNVWGNLALTSLSVRGWVIRLVANALWLVYAARVGATALLANHVLFAVINLYGWWRWSRLR